MFGYLYDILYICVLIIVYYIYYMLYVHQFLQYYIKNDYFNNLKKKIGNKLLLLQKVISNFFF